MKNSLVVSAILATILGATVQVGQAQTVAELESLSAATAKELPGLTIQIGLEKTSFMAGEPIPVKFSYRNEGIKSVSLIPSGQNGSLDSPSRREFRARQLDGGAVLEPETPRFNMFNGLFNFKVINQHQSFDETLFLNDRFFLERPGKYQLTGWSDAVKLNGSKWLQSEPVELEIVPATEAFKTQVLEEAKAQIEESLARAEWRSLGGSPNLTATTQAVIRLGWLHDERAVPSLVAALEIGDSMYRAKTALQNYSREAVKVAVLARLKSAKPVTTYRQIWLEYGGTTAAERQKLAARMDNALRAALRATPDRRKRAYLATKGLANSAALRGDAEFWHEALTNLTPADEDLDWDLSNLVSDNDGNAQAPVTAYPIQTADLKAAFETVQPFQVRIKFFRALRSRDPLYLQQFLLARVDNQRFDFPLGAFDIFTDAQMKAVATKIILRLQSSEKASDSAWRDEYGRRLRDLALRGVTIERMEAVEGWLLQNAPEADAPILDAIALKMPPRAWFWLQLSLTKRPLRQPYDNRMRVLVLQTNPEARGIVRGLLQDAPEARQLEVLNAIQSMVVALPENAELKRWNSSEPVFSRASISTFDDLQGDLEKLTTSETTSNKVREAAARAIKGIGVFKKRAVSPLEKDL